MPGDHEDRDLLVAAAQDVEDLDAVHAGHLDVEEERVRGFALQGLEPLRPGGRFEELVPLVFEDHPQRLADGFLVVDHQDAAAHYVEAGAPEGGRGTG